MSEKQPYYQQQPYMNTPYRSGQQGQSNAYYPQMSPAYYPPYQYNQMPGGMPGYNQMPSGMPTYNQMPPQYQSGMPPGYNQMQTQQQQQGNGQGTGQMLPVEQSYIENILRMNRGKVATIYMTFENNEEWNAKVFKGVVEAAGRDHIIISDSETGKRYLLLMIYLDYITFDEEINYQYPYGAGNQPNMQ